MGSVIIQTDKKVGKPQTANKRTFMDNHYTYDKVNNILTSYTKHFFIESQRIVSKLGDSPNLGKGGTKAGGGKVDYATKKVVYQIIWS